MNLPTRFYEWPFKKGLEFLVKAFAQVARQQQAAHLVLAGPDNEGCGSLVRWWLREEQVLRNTTCTGLLLREEKVAALHGADLFVLPSHSESFGVAVPAAMLCALPAVSSDKVNIWREVAKVGAGPSCRCDPSDVREHLSMLARDGNPARASGDGR